MTSSNVPEKWDSDLETLYQAHYKYIYGKLIGYPEDFKDNRHLHSRRDFLENLEEEAMSIKVNMGY